MRQICLVYFYSYTAAVSFLKNMDSAIDFPVFFFIANKNRNKIKKKT